MLWQKCHEDNICSAPRLINKRTQFFPLLKKRIAHPYPIMKSIYHLRGWPVDLLNTNELKLLHDVWDTCTSSKINSWVIKKVWETQKKKKKKKRIEMSWRFRVCILIINQNFGDTRDLIQTLSLRLGENFNSGLKQGARRFRDLKGRKF